MTFFLVIGVALVVVFAAITVVTVRLPKSEHARVLREQGVLIHYVRTTGHPLDRVWLPLLVFAHWWTRRLGGRRG